MTNALMITPRELLDRLWWLFVCALFALACAQPTPIPCPRYELILDRLHRSPTSASLELTTSLPPEDEPY